MARFRAHLSEPGGGGGEDEEEEEEEEETGSGSRELASSPLIAPGFAGASGLCGRLQQQQDFSVLAALASVLRRSLVMCSAGVADAAAAEGGEGDRPVPQGMDIGWPSDVRHVAHVTFDRFDGFLGLPVEFQPHVPARVPSASASVFGVSANSMQCSYDNRGNSVPTILLLMQRHFYSQGGLQAEGIFRINAENGQEVHVREQLSKGVMPCGIDMHCLAGLIKAWFRELPTGVLDSITPDQMMHCNTEEECSHLVSMLPSMEAALLDWAINLMADVVEHEHQNKMNARNIAMVFAPNMTQMADPLTALIHAVQVMNFLKTLIIKMLREREETAESGLFPTCSDFTSDKDETYSSKSTEKSVEGLDEKTMGYRFFDRVAQGKFLLSTEDDFESDLGESFHSFGKKCEAGEEYDCISGKSSPANNAIDAPRDGFKARYSANRSMEGIMDKLSFRKGVRKLCGHPMFQLNKSIKKSDEIGIENPRGEGREAWA